MEEITDHVQDYVPDASVEITEELQTPSPPKPQPVVRIVHAGGFPTDVQRQGHGLQRTLVIAVLQALADALAAEPGEEQNPAQKSLMLSIEEPELYQHPLQARALATALLELSAGGEPGAGPQIAFSTHSEHFVRPALFEDLRVVRRISGPDSTVVAANPKAVGDALTVVGLSEQGTRVRNTLSVSLSQAVFAKAVVLCEGRTDAAFLEAVASLDRSFEHDGIAVADCHGKSIIPVALAILKELEIPTFVLFDADRQVKEKLEASEKGSEADRQAPSIPLDIPLRAWSIYQRWGPDELADRPPSSSSTQDVGIRRLPGRAPSRDGIWPRSRPRQLQETSLRCRRPRSSKPSLTAWYPPRLSTATVTNTTVADFRSL